MKFDCPRIREAFAGINRPAPEPKGTIDSLALLTQRFGRRAGDMKMASLATYFGLGQQKHRSLDDVRVNLEVLKYCSTVLLLPDSETVSTIYSALESVHASLAIMAYNGMPKQLYKEEIIERILEFSRHQVIDVMLASDPVYRALHRPMENGVVEGRISGSLQVAS